MASPLVVIASHDNNLTVGGTASVNMKPARRDPVGLLLCENACRGELEQIAA
jgi:hypothetical protein